MNRRRSIKLDLIIVLMIGLITITYFMLGSRETCITINRLQSEAKAIPYTTEEVYNRTTGQKEIKEKFESKEDEKRFNDLQTEYKVAILHYRNRILIILLGMIISWLIILIGPSLYYVLPYMVDRARR